MNADEAARFASERAAVELASRNHLSEAEKQALGLDNALANAARETNVVESSTRWVDNMAASTEVTAGVLRQLALQGKPDKATLRAMGLDEQSVRIKRLLEL